ncbi:hypothetical protein B0H16DRAFT_1468145 [Mycena metata]|uniref:DNA helicase n=1 Tax=Mycena metata TaxID=1033252 RepID=A0AAD7I1Z4_9AGAR|nr:hypothetical protein B0H16DRAFT_1468145 [Mycena metata]
MVSCNDFQMLATQAAKARNIHDDSFGALNMVVAGDFAQLPPMSGPSLYSGKVTLQVSDAMDQRNQNAVLGKILWHQFNTVVILRKNMRQKVQSEADDKLRRALENMRYGACSGDDIAFLESRIAGFRPENPKLNKKSIRNVSIITARNSQKDSLNNMGAARFARDTGQTLMHFHSIDRVSARSVDKNKWKGCIQSDIKRMTPRLQRKLWEALPSTTNEYIPGKLSICMGMPIMLRSNDATEMCITKGQEAVVCGWHSIEGPMGQPVLETLFVRLVNPSKKIQIEGLPENVVPLVRTVTHITVLLEDDSLLSVLREQVVCLLNFGMTDYTSQGRSRIENPVELANCKNHMSYYVALSRGVTAEGTVIVQGFDAKKITSGMSGFLRQELRELEILDEITRLRFEGKLPRTVAGLYRRGLIRSFYAWKTDHRDPPHFHPAMRWNASMGPRVTEPVIYSEWRPSGQSHSKRKASSTAHISRQEYVETSNADMRPVKKRKIDQAPHTAMPHLVPQLRKPVGLIWDARDYSCAYDSTFTILGNLWAENPEGWTTYFGRISGGLGEFATLMSSVREGRIPFERARDLVRRGMNGMKPEYFPYGRNNTSVDRIAQVLLPSKYYAVGTHTCQKCGFMDNRAYGMLESYLTASLNGYSENPVTLSVSDWLSNYMTNGRKKRCPSCTQMGRRERMKMTAHLKDVPPIMLFDVCSDRLVFDDELRFMLGRNNEITTLKLRGVIYGGQSHFTCRYIQEDGTIWFNDGITTGSSCLREGKIQDLDDRLCLHRCGSNQAVAIIYAKTRINSVG